ncbi:MAG: endonuclease/exonuclease/phosphatase family protein [Nitrososphaera sp.]|nr:endonuclease/exonuclease/phosphatase family protein [Nitrososphaera sp.]
MKTMMFVRTISGFTQHCDRSQVARVVRVMCIGILLFAMAGISSADTIHVNGCANTGPGDGSQQRPFHTLAEAVAAAARGETIIIQKGAYPERHPESFVISKPVTITASDGPAFIGQHGVMVKRMRILTHNVAALDDTPSLDSDCPTRGRRFGECVANAGNCNGHTGGEPYDIVALQEYWRDNDIPEIYDSCDNDPLLEGINSTGLYSADRRSYLFRPDRSTLKLTQIFCAWGVLNPLLLLLCAGGELEDVDGGLGTFTLHEISHDEDWRWDEGDAIGCRRQGFTFTRIPIEDASLEIDLYNVHLCGDGSSGDRISELMQLRAEIGNRSNSSGNPVIVMGDFNIKGPLELSDSFGGEYQQIMAWLGSPRDLWLEVHPEGPPEQGHTTHSGKRIDYIFVITDPGLTDSRFSISIDQPSDVSVVKWFIEDNTSNPRLTVSDHFGVEASINIHDCQ